MSLNRWIKMWYIYTMEYSVQFSSVTQLCLTICDPMNRSTSGPPVHHQHPEVTQTHAHRVGDAIQPSHPLSFPSPPAPNPSQHQGLFQWVNSSHEGAKVLEFQLQHQSFQWTPRTDLLQDGLVESPCSPRDSQGILLSHKKERNSVSCRDVDEPRACYIKWSKSGKQILYINTYIWNLEKWYWGTYLQARNRGADVKNGLLDTEWGGKKVGWIETVALTYILYRAENS